MRKSLYRTKLRLLSLTKMPEISIKSNKAGGTVWFGHIIGYPFIFFFVFFFVMAVLKDYRNYLSKGIEPPDIVSMLLWTKLKQEVEERIPTTSLHNSLFEGASSIQNIESHCVNHMVEMIVLGWNNHYIRDIWSKNLVNHIISLTKCRN